MCSLKSRTRACRTSEPSSRRRPSSRPRVNQKAAISNQISNQSRIAADVPSTAQPPTRGSWTATTSLVNTAPGRWTTPPRNSCTTRAARTAWHQRLNTLTPRPGSRRQLQPRIRARASARPATKATAISRTRARCPHKDQTP